MDEQIQEGAQAPVVGDAAGEQEIPTDHIAIRTSSPSVSETPVATPSPVVPAPSAPQPGRRVANYVLASGVNMGATVAVVPMADNPVNIGGECYADLALVESPDKLYQTKARYSDGNEPGTWRWA